MQGAREAIWVLVILAAPISGCLTADQSDATDPDPLVAPAPEWVPGQWWDWRIEHPLTGVVREVRTVVTGGDRDAYRVGAASLESGLDAVVFHVPPMGVVRRPDLSWEAHEQWVDLVDFPLRDGMTWEGQDELTSEPMVLEARLAPAQPTGQGPLFHVTGVRADGSKAVAYTYSPMAGTFLELVRYTQRGSPFLTLTLTDFGVDETRPAMVITVDDAYMGATGSPAGGAVPPAWPAARDAFELPGDGDHLLLASFLGGAPGTYAVDYQTPDGETISLRHDNPPGEGGVVLETELAEAVPGTWSVSLVSAGQGFAFAEAMTLHTSEERPRR